MKKYLFVAIFFLAFTGFGQKSFYFASPYPGEANKVSAVDKQYHGKYHSEEYNRTYLVDAEGIFVLSTQISRISRETIRETSTYEVRDGYLFGVMKGDSLPCVLEGEYYYFGVRNKEVLFSGTDASEKSILIKSKSKLDTYYLNLKEHNRFVPIELHFDKHGMHIASFDYESDSEEFDFIKEKELIPAEYHELVVLNPDKDEWEKLQQKVLFPTVHLYKKIK